MKRHREHISEWIMKLRCPKCDTWFIDYSNCAALHCSNKECNCAFCAVCFKPCGDNAHTHVRENHAEHKGGTNFNVATDVWNELMRVRKKTKLEKYWPSIPEDVREILVDDVRVRQHFLELRMPVPKEVRFQGELAQMHSLGLRDHAMNVRALRQFGGDLEMACQEVRRNQWNIRGRDCGNGILSYRITATSVANGVVSRELTEYTLASQQFSRLGQQHPTMIDVYENPTLKTRYDATRRSFAASGKPAEEVFVFHGTASANVELIMKTGTPATPAPQRRMPWT